MRHRTLDEMIAYFNRQVSDMDIKREYKIQLLGMITAIGYEASAQPERKKGKWIVDDEYIDCSVCRHEKWSRVPYEDLVKRFKFCPNCGADMRGEEHGRHL